jgi:hypothetical protein
VFGENKDLFNTSEMVAINKKLLKINKASLRIIAIIRFMKDNAAAIKAGRLSMKTIVVTHIQKVAGAIGCKTNIKIFSALIFSNMQNLQEISAASGPFSIYAEYNIRLNSCKNKSM